MQPMGYSRFMFLGVKQLRCGPAFQTSRIQGPQSTSESFSRHWEQRSNAMVWSTTAIEFADNCGYISACPRYMPCLTSATTSRRSRPSTITKPRPLRPMRPVRPSLWMKSMDECGTS